MSRTCSVGAPWERAASQRRRELWEAGVAAAMAGRCEPRVVRVVTVVVVVVVALHLLVCVYVRVRVCVCVQVNELPSFETDSPLDLAGKSAVIREVCLHLSIYGN